MIDYRVFLTYELLVIVLPLLIILLYYIIFTIVVLVRSSPPIKRQIDLEVSFIVPTYNEESYIRQKIDALRVTKPNDQIIVVDSGSTDTTPSILSEYAKKRYIDFIKEDKRKGKAIALNKAFSEARGENRNNNRCRCVSTS